VIFFTISALTPKNNSQTAIPVGRELPRRPIIPLATESPTFPFPSGIEISIPKWKFLN
jgi:hypothetical protein